MLMEHPMYEMVSVHYRKMTNGFVFMKMALPTGRPRRSVALQGEMPSYAAMRLQIPGLSAGAEAGQDDGHGAVGDFECEPEGPVVDILEVEFHPLVEADLVAAADLPDAGEAGLHGEAAAMPRIVVLHLGRDGRPGADEAHVADENIPELRELVDAGATEETAERSDARVVLHLEDGAAHFVVSLEFRAQHFR